MQVIHPGFLHLVSPCLAHAHGSGPGVVFRSCFTATRKCWTVRTVSVQYALLLVPSATTRTWKKCDFLSRIQNPGIQGLGWLDQAVRACVVLPGHHAVASDACQWWWGQRHDTCQLVGQAMHRDLVWPLYLSGWAEPWQSMSSTAVCVDVWGAVFWLLSFHLAFSFTGHLWPWVMDLFLPIAHGLSFVKYLLYFWRTM